MPSPKVIVREFNFSHYLSSMVDFGIGVVGVAEKGPVNVRTLVTTPDQLLNYFGRPLKGFWGMMACYQFLKIGNLVNFVRVAGTDATKAMVEISDSTLTIDVKAKHVGSWYNRLGIIIADDGLGAFTIYVMDINTENTYATYTEVTLDNIIEKMSDNDDIEVTLTGTGTMPTGTFVLTGGDDGSVEPDYIGEILGTSRTGLQLFRNWRDVDVYATAVPGITTENVQVELLDIAGTRKDEVAFLDCPPDLTPAEAVDFHNGEGSFADRGTLQSLYGTIHYGWPRIWNPFSDEYEYVPPSVALLYAAGKTVAEFELWYAMAGLERGRLPWAMGVDVNAEEGDMDFMYDIKTNCINPIINYPGQGTVIWGQKTLSREMSARNRLNVRYVMIYILRAARSLLPSLIMKPNTELLWAEFNGAFDPFLSNLVARTGLIDYKLICDSSTTTAYDIDNYLMKAKIMVKPVKAAEVIIVDMNILSTGANFDEYTG